MNKELYLEIKKKRASESFNERPICLECFRPKKACFCDVISSFDTNTNFQILMHPMEAKREQVGTGRMAYRALNNCELVVGEGFEENSHVNELLNNPTNNCFLLYPGKNSTNLTHQNLAVQKNKKLVIFILDSTWACSKKMLRLSSNLKSLPRISFEPNYLSRFAIKKQPKDYCLSTIESIFRVIQELESQGIEDVGDKKETLRDSLARMVKFHQTCAADPSINHYRHRK